MKTQTPVRPPALPSTWADPAAVRGYVASMSDRARQLAGPATVYVSASPFLVRSKVWPARLANIDKRLPGVQFESFSSLFERHTEQYKDGWDAVVEMLDGVVVCLQGGEAGPGLAREIRGAVRHRLPVLVASGDRLVPLVDCRVQPHPAPDPRHALIITLPAPVHDDQRLTYRASLAALGVTA